MFGFCHFNISTAWFPANPLITFYLIVDCYQAQRQFPSTSLLLSFTLCRRALQFSLRDPSSPRIPCSRSAFDRTIRSISTRHYLRIALFSMPSSLIRIRPCHSTWLFLQPSHQQPTLPISLCGDFLDTPAVCTRVSRHLSFISNFLTASLSSASFWNLNLGSPSTGSLGVFLLQLFPYRLCFDTSS